MRSTIWVVLANCLAAELVAFGVCRFVGEADFSPGETKINLEVKRQGR
jgi:hypothetical protein